jgi:DNA-binding NtrC family response regulator
MAEATKLLVQSRPGVLAMQGARLVVLRGPDRGRALALAREEVVVGTGGGADLALSDETVSRNHLAIRVQPDGFLLRDLDSTNGTYLDGRRVREAWIAPGDKIDFGASRIRLEATRQTVDLPLSEAHGFGKMVGRSVAARRLFALLEQVAREAATVALYGETGTGKDLAAEGIHAASPRASGPFVVVDCGAIPPALMESELFGHERGAFTGADRARTGAITEAHGGTLFLDEIGELQRELQPKLLRALEKRQVRPLGSSKYIDVDVRIVSATTRDLKRDVNRGLFREDLYYRLHVVSIRLPPLRERLDDVPLLAEHFQRELGGAPGAELSPSLIEELLAHDWPGNVRELRNRIERELAAPDAPRSSELRTQPSYREAKAQALDAFEASFLRTLMGRAANNVSEAARLAQMDRPFLGKLLRKHGLK